MFNKKADGVQFLVLLIGIVLVAAIAAVIFVERGNAIRDDSLGLFSDSQEGLLTNLDVVRVLARDTSDGEINAGDNITIVLRLNDGSPRINVNNLIVELNALNFGSTFYNFSLTPQNDSFTLNYILQRSGIDFEDLVEGETFSLNFQVPPGVVISEFERLDIFVHFSNLGQKVSISTTLPSSLTAYQTSIFP